MNMKLLISAEGKTRGDRIRNQILKEELEFKICQKLDEKQLKWLGHVRGIDRAGLL